MYVFLHAKKACVEVDVFIVNFGKDGSKWSASYFGRFTTRELPVLRTEYEASWVSVQFWTDCSGENLVCWR